MVTCVVCDKPILHHPRCALCGILTGVGHEVLTLTSGRCLSCRNFSLEQETPKQREENYYRELVGFMQQLNQMGKKKAGMAANREKRDAGGD